MKTEMIMGKELNEEIKDMVNKEINRVKQDVQEYEMSYDWVCRQYTNIIANLLVEKKYISSHIEYRIAWDAIYNEFMNHLIA